MKAKIINFSTSYSRESNSWSYWDFIWLQKMWIEFTQWEDYDIIIFSLSSLNFFWWQVSDHTVKCLKALKEANIKKIPVLCLFLDFKCFTKKIWNRKWFEYLLEYQFEDYCDNWYLLHYCRDEEKLKKYVESIKDWIKFKQENIMYFNNETVWFYEPKPWLEDSNWKICYIWNWRWWARTRFLSRFFSIDIFWRWKDKDKTELSKNNNNFLWVLQQSKVKDMLNLYFWHLITYDDIWIKFKTDVTRLIYTVASWCLPLIDDRLKYLWLPSEFEELFISDYRDVVRILWMEKTRRLELIAKLQIYFSEKLENEKKESLNKIISLSLKKW